MKKYVFLFSLFIFHLSLCFAQDTLVYKSGEKVAVNVLSVIEDDVNYTIPPSKKQKTAKLWDFNYIKYEDGTIYSYGEYKAKQDSIANKWKTIHDSIYRVNNPDYRPIYINAGIGASLMTLATPGSSIFSDELSAITESPAYNATIIYQLLSFMSFGVGYAYQWFTDHPQYEEDNVATWETEKISRLNISGLLLFHSESKYCDGYVGLRIGESTWTDKITLNTQSSFAPANIFQTMPNSTIQRGSFQILAGIQFYPLYNIGIHTEAGIGTPYFTEIGLTFRIKTRKVK